MRLKQRPLQFGNYLNDLDQLGIITSSHRCRHRGYSGLRTWSDRAIKSSFWKLNLMSFPLRSVALHGRNANSPCPLVQLAKAGDAGLYRGCRGAMKSLSSLVPTLCFLEAWKSAQCYSAWILLLRGLKHIRHTICCLCRKCVRREKDSTHMRASARKIHFTINHTIEWEKHLCLLLQM